MGGVPGGLWEGRESPGHLQRPSAPGQEHWGLLGARSHLEPSGPRTPAEPPGPGIQQLLGEAWGPSGPSPRGLGAWVTIQTGLHHHSHCSQRDERTPRPVLGSEPDSAPAATCVHHTEPGCPALPPSSPAAWLPAPVLNPCGQVSPDAESGLGNCGGCGGTEVRSRGRGGLRQDECMAGGRLSLKFPC